MQTVCVGGTTWCDLPWPLPLDWQGGHQRMGGVALPSRRGLLPWHSGGHHSSSSLFPQKYLFTEMIWKKKCQGSRTPLRGEKGIFTVPLLLDPPLPALAKSPESLPTLSLSAVLLVLVGLPLLPRQQTHLSPAPELDCRHRWLHPARVLNGAGHSCNWRTFSIGTDTASRLQLHPVPTRTSVQPAWSAL